MAILIAFYIVVAVGVAATTSAGTQHVSAGTSWKCIPHPSWAWWLVSSFPWATDLKQGSQPAVDDCRVSHLPSSEGCA